MESNESQPGQPQPSRVFALFLLIARCGLFPVVAVLVFAGSLTVRWNDWTAALLAKHATWYLRLAHRLPEFYANGVAATAVLGLLLSVLAAIAVTVLWSRRPLEPDCCPTGDAAAPQAKSRLRLVWFWVASGVCVLAVVSFVVAMALKYSVCVLPIWLLAQAAALAAAFIWDRRQGVSWRGCFQWSELGIVAVAALALTVLCAWDVNSWKYGCIGDEWGHYQGASGWVASGKYPPERVLGDYGFGVYGENRPFTTFVQSLVMTVFGTDNFGWRLANVIFFSLSLFPLFIAARMFMPRRACFFALGVYAFSNCLITEAHWGYGHALWRLSALSLLAALAILWRTRSMLALACTALAMGYANLIGGVMSPGPLAGLAGIVWLLWRREKRLPDAPQEPGFPLGRTLLCAALALAVYYPLFHLPTKFYVLDAARSSGYKAILWKTSVGALLTHYYGPDWCNPPCNLRLTPQEFVDRCKTLGLQGVLAPTTYRGISHYIVDYAADPMSSALIVFGMAGALLGWLGWRRGAFLMGCFAGWLVLTCVLSQYSFVSITRVQFLVLFWAFFAGIGLERLLGCLDACGATVSRWAWRVVPVALLAGIAFWNLKTFYAMPEEKSASKGWSAVCMMLRAAQEAPPEAKVYACFQELWHPMTIHYSHYPQADRIEPLTLDRFWQCLYGNRFKRGDRLLWLDRGPDQPYRPLLDWIAARYPQSSTFEFDHCGLTWRSYGFVFDPQPAPAAAAAATAVQAATEISIAQTGYCTTPNELEVWTRPPYGKNVKRETPRVGGVESPDACLVPGPGSIVLFLPPGYSRFRGQLAMEDFDDPAGAKDSVAVDVLIDDATVQDTFNLSRGQPPAALDVALGAGSTLTIRCSCPPLPYGRICTLCLTTPRLLREEPAQ